MKNCPNCSAELEERPCKACGWPETTQPPPRTFWQKVARQQAREDATEDASGCSFCAVFVALAATFGAYVFYSLGERAHWTSDGPGILIAYLGVAACGLVALTTWGSIVGGSIVRRLPPWLRFWIQ